MLRSCLLCTDGRIPHARVKPISQNKAVTQAAIVLFMWGSCGTVLLVFPLTPLDSSKSTGDGTMIHGNPAETRNE